jgi:hypothetical protein
VDVHGHWWTVCASGEDTGCWQRNPKNALGVKGSQIQILSSRRPSLLVREGENLLGATLPDVLSD